MPGLHAILSASSAKRWLACPPSARLEEKLKGWLGTKVSIARKKNNKGKIEIEYYSQEELERILELFETIK